MGCKLNFRIKSSILIVIVLLLSNSAFSQNLNTENMQKEIDSKTIVVQLEDWIKNLEELMASPPTSTHTQSRHPPPFLDS